MWNNQTDSEMTPPRLTSMCDDTLLRILSYCSLSSLVRLTRGTSKQLRDRFDPTKEHDGELNDQCQNIWREVFAHHNFAPVHKNDLLSRHDYYQAVRHRLQLFARIAGKRRKSKKKAVKQCFSLPDRYFNFLPLVPPDMMSYPPSSHDADDVDVHFQEMEDEFDDMDFHPNEHADANMDRDMEFDPPPVEFTCDSFVLTSHGTGTEYVLLNPFSGSIEVYNSILDNALGSEENLMELAMYDASENILRKRNNRLQDDEIHDYEEELSQDIAGEAIHSRIQPKLYDTPPSQVLFSVQDYFDLDLDEYFGRHTPFAARRRGNVTVDWVGVDTHVAMSHDCKSVKGNLIGVARILTMESEERGDEEINCTEIFAWSNIDSNIGIRYTSKFVCRAAGSFYFLDICANTHKLYATFQSGSDVFQESNLDLESHIVANRNRSLMEIDEESLVGEDGEPIRMSRFIYRLPLVKYDGDAKGPDAIKSYFPTPEVCIAAQHPVSSFSVDTSGQILLVGTVHGTVEMWHTGVKSGNYDSNPCRLEILSVRESFLRRARSMTIGARCRIDATVDKSDTDDTVHVAQQNETQDDLALIEGTGDNELPHKNPTSKISQIYLPRHLPVQSCGFVTKQRDSESGTTLLLWQTKNMSTGGDISPTDQRFQIVSMINLPLSSRCHPEVHYDGRRLIVFGQDHIGLIVLVYHVLGTRYDQHEFQDPPKKMKGKGNEESGGVINLLDERRLIFVNRVRHAGLGGLDYFDSLIVTANERFIVVNTKSGNLVASDGTRNASQGLLVIDLQEHDD